MPAFFRAARRTSKVAPWGHVLYADRAPAFAAKDAQKLVNALVSGGLGL